MKNLYLSLFVIVLLINSCTKNTPEITEEIEELDEWLIDTNDLYGGFLLYPLGDNPQYVSVDSIDMPDDERVGVMSFDDEVRVYPYVNTFETEIINDTYLSQKFAFTYCPLTKSAIAYVRNKTLRASGYLYKNNMVPWDEDTETLWSQMLIRGIKGENIDKRLNTLPVVETKWKTVKEHFTQAKILKEIVPTTDRVNKPSKNANTNQESYYLPEDKELVYGILDNDDNVIIYQYKDFSKKNRYDIILKKNKYIVYGNESRRIINALEVDDFNKYKLLPDSDFPYILEDLEGVKYNVFGVGVNGEKLGGPKYAYVAAWWAFKDFFENFTFQE